MRRQSNIWLICLLCFALLLSACDEADLSETAPAAQQSSASSNSLDAIKAYFNNPETGGGGLEKIAIRSINAAKSTLEVVSFDFNLPVIVDALAQAQARGVQVRVVIDSTSGSCELKASQNNGEDYNACQALADANISAYDGGRSSGLMHDKFIIVDGKRLLVGSWNMSYNDTFRNDNNLLVIDSAKLSGNYLAKFNEMYDDALFGAKSEVGAKIPSLTIEGVQIENYFAPVDEVSQHLAQIVGKAEHSIRFMAFVFTDDVLAQTMLDRAADGVTVEGVFENRSAQQGAFPSLFCADLPVMLDGNKGTMHHKVIIIDEQIVVTGSFNFTHSADTVNDENVLVFHSPELAQAYLKEFARVKALAVSPPASEVTCP